MKTIEKEAAQNHREKRFKKFYIEITSICNLACTFCPPTQRQANFIQIEQFRHILSEIKMHTRHLYFHLKGEPLLHPKIDQLLDISEEMDFLVNITTNGTLIKKNRSKLLGKKALRQINFSLHSYDGHAESEKGKKLIDFVSGQESIEISQIRENRAESLSFEGKKRYIEDIILFIQDAQQVMPQLIFSLRLWNLDWNNDVNKARERNREILGMLEDAFQIKEPIEDQLIRGKGIKIGKNVFINQDVQFVWPSLDEERDLHRGFCHGLRNQAGVLVDGTVVPCCLDGEGVINLGNVYHTAFTNIIAGERAQRIVDGFSRREVVEELCKRCDYRRRFGN